VLTATTPLALVLEDLPGATLDARSAAMLAAPARSRPACSSSHYRPVDVIVAGHPLRDLVQELQPTPPMRRSSGSPS
jgi:hypothetical protein